MPGSITGSIGVIMEYPNVSDLMEKVGVEMQVVKAGTQKDLGSPFRDMGPEDRAILTALVEDVHDQFIQAVAEGRGLAPEDVVPLADGRVLSGRQARSAGLIDRFGNLDDAIAVAGRMSGLGPTPRLARPPSDDGDWLLDLLLGQTAAGTVRQMVRNLGGGTAGLGPALKYIVH
ncbi:MAG: S49 family peptidase [Gemmatimonadota bacterium]